jgi:hypothetical protein
MSADALPEEVRRELEAIDAALAGEPVDPELTDLGRLALALREERPDPRPAFTRDLDSRAAAGFPRRRRLAALREKLRAAPMLVPGTALAGLIAFAVVVSVVSGPQERFSSDGAGGGSVATQEAEPTEDAPPPAAPPADAVGGGSGQELQSDSSRSKSTPLPIPAASAAPATGGGSPASDDRRARLVERSASITLVSRPDELERTADAVVRVTDRLGGFVVTSSVSAAEDGGGGEFLIRVPSERLQDALAGLSELAHVRAREQSTQDITREGVSARDRLDEARAERRSLLRRIARAITDEQTDALRARLRGVDDRIADARADLARVDNRARFSNVTVTLEADPSAADRADDGTWSPGDAARDALRVLEVAAGVLLLVAAIALPLGLLAVLGILAARASRRRGRERALDSI